MFQRRVANEIFVHSDLRTVIARIEVPVDAQLAEEIKMACPLRIEEQRKPRIEKKAVVRLDQARRALVDEITFEVNQAAELQLKLLLGTADGEHVVHSIQ